MRYAARAVLVVEFLFLLFTPLHSSAATNRIIVFANGYLDCCAWNMGRVISYVQERGMAIHQVSWTHFTHGSRSRGVEPRGTERFVAEGIAFLNSLPDGTEVFLIGHSWGADSLLHLVESYRRSRIKIRLLAVIDPVSTAGFRNTLRQFTVGNHVEYFFNRWQNNQPFPNDFQADGEIACHAFRSCDQAVQPFHKNADGSTVTRRCGWQEFGCSGRRENPLNSDPGYVNKRTGHAGLATDGWIEAQLIRIIDELDPSSKGVGSSQVYTIISMWHGGYLDVDEGSGRDGARVQTWGSSGGGKRNQQWRLQALGNNVYNLISVANGGYLDVDENSRRDGARVQTWGSSGDGKRNQQWRLQSLGNNVYNLISVANGGYLDVDEGSRQNGARVQTWGSSGDGKRNQQWQLLPAR